MKKILFAVATLFAVSAVSAQNLAEKCYRGNVDLGYMYSGGNDSGIMYGADMIAINTSHGYQFNQHLFLGAGIGFHFYQKHESTFVKRAESVEIPLFVNVRGTIGKGKTSVFADLKAGAYASENMYKYLNGMLGLRFATDEKKAVTVSFGMELVDLQFLYRHYEYTHDSQWNSITIETTDPRKAEVPGLSLKVGYDF